MTVLPYATRWLLATDVVILNHSQVTRTTSELAPLPSPNYHITPTGGRLSSRQIKRASFPYTADLKWYWARTHDMPAMILDHWAAAAPYIPPELVSLFSAALYR
ncbi:hypothetical protein TNCV_844191 [Trichonephila clavipes]|nr:hypothetical protein TNCV_844191 [Trichonephila clavipes]